MANNLFAVGCTRHSRLPFLMPLMPKYLSKCGRKKNETYNVVHTHKMKLWREMCCKKCGERAYLIFSFFSSMWENRARKRKKKKFESIFLKKKKKNHHFRAFTKKRRKMENYLFFFPVTLLLLLLLLLPVLLQN